jgi:hypothetical protein
MNTADRPTSVTVIAWILIVMYAYTAVAVLATAHVPAIRKGYEKVGRSMPFSIALTTVMGVVGVISGIAMLKGRNWGRALYLVLIPASYVVVLAAWGFSSAQVPGLIIYAVILAFLMRPAASAFFRGGAPVDPSSPE